MLYVSPHSVPSIVYDDTVPAKAKLLQDSKKIIIWPFKERMGKHCIGIREESDQVEEDTAAAGSHP